ncbi:MAG TPA: tetratricopeptide repeat protein [Polyangia bacterium]|jgi:predicted Zn finger-like uncharacterized protein|nr:tetratricopeptide repeat protein [Polyangia bacterium]
MDVRCDRCQTEYELDDRSVTDAGASVQCTSCGHTFVVSRQRPSSPSAPPRPPGTPAMGVQQTDPATADWLLATEEGQTHRFRDLTTLHKWIVERKVTREDRISQKGGPWRQLGDLLDLAPFFDVVAQADRARAAEPTSQFQRPGASGGSGLTPVRPSPVGSRQSTPRIPDADEDEDSDLYTSGQFPGPEVPTRVPLDPVIDDDFPPSLQPATNRGAKIVTGLMVVVGLAAVAAYAGFKQPNWFPFFKRPDVAAEPVSAPATPAPAGQSARPAVAAVPAAAPSPPAPAPAPAAPAAAPAAVMPTAAVPAAAAADNHKAPTGKPAAAELPSATPKPKSYDRLIADADRLLENGQSGRAQKLYDEALGMQPNGVAALTGEAYVLLDREKVMSSIATFRRALAARPDFPAATFGLAEAYRAQGENTQAVEIYKRYLAVSPAGPDAPAARGQIKALEGTASRRAEPPSPTATIPASSDPTAPPSSAR